MTGSARETLSVGASMDTTSRRSPWARAARGAFVAVIALVVAASTAGCDRLASGEGHLNGAVVGPGEPFGSAVLVVAGEGVMDVVGEGGARAWTESSEDDVLRVVVVQTQETGAINFRIRVRDRSAPAPAVTVVQIAGLDDELLRITPQHRVLIGR